MSRIRDIDKDKSRSWRGIVHTKASLRKHDLQDFYKILKIICNIQINVIQIAQVLSGNLLRTFDNIVIHE